MANKEKNTKEEPYLLNDNESLGEIEKKTITTYDEKDREAKPDEISKAIKKAKPEDVSYNEDGSISVKEGDVNEVEKTQVLKFDIKKSQDVKSLQQMLDKQGVERGKMSIGTDGTISISEGINKKSRIIKAKSLIETVNNFNKIDLSESEIMSILVKTQNPVMKKSELIESIQEKLLNEANMNDNVRQSFESGENDYSDFLDSDLINQLARESFEEIADNLRRKTGKQDVSFDDVQQLLSTSLMAAAKEEYRLGIENMERRAVEMIKKEYKIPEGSVEFVATITGIPPKALVGRDDLSPAEMEQLSRQLGLKVGKVEKGDIKRSVGTKQPPQNKTHEELKPKIKRRRFTNAMIHGAGRKSQNLHHSDDQLRDENPQLVSNYSNIMAANDANYFLMDDEAIKAYGETGIHAGNVRVDLTNPKKPKIIAQGMVFPILLHELGKGVLELMSLWGLPQDKQERQYVLDKTDHLDYETNDIRLGTKMWERFIGQIPVDNQEVISLTWNIFQSLGDEEYNSIIEGLIANRTEAKQKVRRMAEEAIEELRAEEYEEALGGYKDSDEEEEDVMTPEEDEEEDDVLKNILNKQDTEEEEEVDYERMSRRELEIEIDRALDDNDMELVKYLGSILNRK